MIIPTPGRVVWYYSGDGDTAYCADKEQPMAALVAFVHDERMLNLAVVDHTGTVSSRQNVKLLQDEDEKPEDGSSYATWMPYQLGQAAKVEGATGK